MTHRVTFIPGDGTGPELAEAVVSGQAHGAVAQSAYIDGFNEILVVAAVVAFVGGVVSFALVRSRDFVAQQQEPVPA